MIDLKPLAAHPSPREASGLGPFRHKLMAFRNGRHDDQADRVALAEIDPVEMSAAALPSQWPSANEACANRCNTLRTLATGRPICRKNRARAVVVTI